MAAKPPSAAIRAMLVERDIALWDAAHFTTAASKTPGRPTMKDPVRVNLVTPRVIDRVFTGTGATTDEAVLDALARNSGLNLDEHGITGAMARCENALHALQSVLWQERWERIKDDPDADIPF